MDSCIDSDTRLAYVTTEVLVQKLIRNRSLDRYTHIILDEVHERDEHTDFALLVVKKLLHTVSPRVKVSERIIHFTIFIGCPRIVMPESRELNKQTIAEHSKDMFN